MEYGSGTAVGTFYGTGTGAGGGPGQLMNLTANMTF